MVYRGAFNFLFSDSGPTSAPRGVSEPMIRLCIRFIALVGCARIWEKVRGLPKTSCRDFARRSRPWQSFLDGLGNGLGYGAILVAIAIGRELLGSGSILGLQLVPEAAYAAGYVNMGLMVLPPGAFILLGLLIWAQRAWSGYTEEA